jgi:hypothetical protein
MGSANMGKASLLAKIGFPAAVVEEALACVAGG